MAQQFTREFFEKLAVETAAKSLAVKRKVGCVIVANNDTYATGYNYNPDSKVFGCCEDLDGKTLPSVIHAEVAAINAFSSLYKQLVTALDVVNLEVYVTHQPCDNCKKAIANFAELMQANTCETIIVEQGLKFDDAKTDFTMVPRLFLQAIAAVYNFGAKTYKRDNWRKVDPQRYVAAIERHWDAYMSGEILDKDSKLPHLAHLATNISFLMALDHRPARQQTLAEYLEKINKNKA